MIGGMTVQYKVCPTVYINAYVFQQLLILLFMWNQLNSFGSITDYDFLHCTHHNSSSAFTGRSLSITVL